MAILHPDATIIPSKLEVISGWIAEQRWYAAKGRSPRLRRLSSWRLDDRGGQVGIETVIVADDASTPPTVYQVPLTYRGAPEPTLEPALIGVVEHSVLGTRWVYDAPHDPVYAGELFALATGQVRAASSAESDAVDPDIAGIATTGETLRLISSRVLTGEQSNTSIIAVAADGAGGERPVIIKVFRTLADGDNPDVVVQGTLAAAGSTRVPASLGSISGSWPAPDGGPSAHGHFALAQEFLPGAQDAWREALLAARTGSDFTDQARLLGDATAEVHEVLAAQLPTEPADAGRIGETLAGMRARLAAALAECPQLARHTDAVEAIFTAAEQADWPPFQRIHGDFHLGQVLLVPGRGWVLLDFEGEPLRPLAERNRTDQTMRDVAGMLRSFDYAGGSLEQETRGFSARAWVAAAQDAFVAGYAARAGSDPRTAGPLLGAYLVDKALYEVVYETRNRPTWVGIPLAALDRLLPHTDATKEELP
ncbi:MAG: phosphotransferase [Tetrasphaera sp.]